MRHRHFETSDACRKIVAKARYGAGQLRAPGLSKLLGRDLGHRGAGCAIGAKSCGFQLAPALGRNLAFEIVQLGGKTPLAKSAWQALIGGADSPGAPSVTTGIGSRRPRAFRSRKKSGQHEVSSLVPGWSPSSTLAPVLVMPQAASTASRGCPKCKRSAMPSTNRYASSIAREIAPSELLILAHSALAHSTGR